MKLTLLISLLFVPFVLQSAEVRVTRMERVPEFETSFILTTNIESKVVLDCQSFIQGLFLGVPGSEKTIVLEEWECADLGERMADSLRQKRAHCLDLSDELLVLNSHSICD